MKIFKFAKVHEVHNGSRYTNGAHYSEAHTSDHFIEFLIYCGFLRIRFLAYEFTALNYQEYRDNDIEYCDNMKGHSEGDTATAEHLILGKDKYMLFLIFIEGFFSFACATAKTAIASIIPCIEVPLKIIVIHLL